MNLRNNSITLHLVDKKNDIHSLGSKVYVSTMVARINK